MIRINLLTVPRARAVKRQWDVGLELASAIAVMILVLAGWWFYGETLESEIVNKQTEKQDKEKELALLKDKVKQVQDFEQKKKLLEDKNRIIDELERARIGPVKVLDYVSQSLEPLNLWVVRLAMKGNTVEIDGRAMTNDDVVEFVNNLRRTDYFTDINLLESRAAVESQISLFQFKLGFRLKG